LKNSRKLRTALVATLTTGLVAAFAALGGGTVAHATSAGQYQYGKQKVALCHKGHHTIRVAQPAVAAHLRHGDVRGTCASVRAKKAKAKAAKAAAVAKAAAKAAEKAAKAAEHAAKGDNGNGKAKGKGK
jgi:hypothetical protein